MVYEEESEYKTCHYRCIDPIENLKIKVILQPIKSIQIALPKFEKDGSSPDIASFTGEPQSDLEEYTFKWQEKVFSKYEFKKYSNEPDWKRKLTEKYNENITEELDNLNNQSNKLFSYVEADSYSPDEADVNIFTEKTHYVSALTKKIGSLKLSEQSIQNYKNIPKRKIIKYSSADEIKNQRQLMCKSIQKMFIMVDMGSKIKASKKAETEEICESVLCTLSYDFSNNTLQVTPAFSESKLKPYIVGMNTQDSRNSYYYWVYHVSPNIPPEDLTKDIKLMTRVFDHQEELRKLHLNSEFFISKPNYLSVTLLGEIISAQDFEYDHLHVHYFIKLPSGWECSDENALVGRTQTSFRNSEGFCFFSYLFEMNFLVELKTFEDFISISPELFFEVLSVDNYRRYRNEGCTYVSVPKNPGIHIFTLNCWRPLDKTVRSQLERFFIGGGPELEDVSCIGASAAENAEIMSRFGCESAPSGKIDLKLSILHQSEVYIPKKGESSEAERNMLNKLDAGSLLGSVNTLIEAFRRARERMLQAKKGLDTDLNYSTHEDQNDFERRVTIKEPEESK